MSAMLLLHTSLVNLVVVPDVNEQNFVAFDNIGYLDAHLLAAVSLTPPARLWTRDKRLAVVAANLGLAYR
jgi:hypothetical protein